MLHRTCPGLRSKSIGVAGTCIEMFPVTVKGIRSAVRIYEIPWQTPG
jgi:hypothetical protein